MFPLRSRRNAIHMCTLENNVIHVHCKRSFLIAMVARDFNIIREELKWLQICEFLIEIIFILYLNTTLFYNFMLPVNRYLAMNTFCRSMTYYQKSNSLLLKGLRPLLKTWPGSHELIKMLRVMKHANINISLRTYTCTSFFQ